MRKSVEAVVPGVQTLPQRRVPAVRGGLMALAIASAALLYPLMASALGLGEITLHSALNQPLDADIELVEAGGLNEEDIVARLASPEAYAQAGVERVFFLNDLRFTPIMHGNRGVIHVVSSKPVTEPFLNFLVQISRPNGDLLHEYTVLLDPATTPAGKAAVQGRNRASIAQSAESRMPVAPPPALKGKHYAVVAGDSLSSIAHRLHGAGAKVSAEELATGIKALNPQAFPGGASKDLRVGQNLLLPDAAVLPEVPTPASAAPTAAAPAAVASATPPGDVPRNAEQLASAIIENQQLTQAVDELKQQLTGRDKEIVTLQTQLAELKAAPAARPAVVAAAPAPAVVAPVAAQPPAAVPVPAPDDSFLSPPILFGLLLILLLLLGLVYSRRRNRRQQVQPVDDHQPLPADPGPAAAVFEVPAVSAPRIAAAPAMVAPVRPQTPPASRSANPPDALDGVNIYIAYGRFTEALGILRDALAKQPERMDIRARILELLAEQGDISGFGAEAQTFIAEGLDAQKVEEIRGRYPQLKTVETPVPVTPAVAAVAVMAAAAPKTEAGTGDDEFQLNLDDLSMDADWDLVDPFDTPRSPKQDSPVAEDPEFSSNLTQLPEVFEMPEEQFLSDFAEPEDDLSEPEIVAEPVVQAGNDALDDDFLDGFMDVSSDFDLLDLDETPLSKINQAQMLIDEGDVESARLILQQVLEEGDEAHRRSAREMLEGLA